jgi:hypothetical protein
MEDVGTFYWPFGIFFGLLVCFMAVWYICWSFSRFGMLYQEKSGNPVPFLLIVTFAQVKAIQLLI